MNTIEEVIEKIFIPQNYVENIGEDDYKRIAPIVNALEAIARISYQSIYIIDYNKNNFMYVSDNPLLLCGLNSQEVKEMGYRFYIDYVPEDEINMLLEICEVGFLFFKNTPVEDRMKLSISYDFHIKQKKRVKLINHKLTPIELTDNGNIWLAVCCVSYASNKTAGNIEVYMKGNSMYWIYSLKNKRWQQKKRLVITSKEDNILSLAAQGYTGKEIADKSKIKEYAEKFQRKKLFQKLKVSNISAALSLVFEKKLM